MNGEISLYVSVSPLPSEFHSVLANQKRKEKKNLPPELWICGTGTDPPVITLVVGKQKKEKKKKRI